MRTKEMSVFLSDDFLPEMRAECDRFEKILRVTLFFCLKVFCRRKNTSERWLQMKNIFDEFK